MNQAQTFLGNHLLQTVDSTPFEPNISSQIREALKSHGFDVQDNGHHISVFTRPKGTSDEHSWECACIYIEDNTLWVKALALRWWQLFNIYDDDPHYQQFWTAIDSLNESAWSRFKAEGFQVIQGTVGELNLGNSKKSKSKSIAAN